ncbi:MAG: glutamine amidotransferase [Deferribacteraceae bacterium]|jgi:GMP synthase (glutamine-hydrolysing)|nr:glutamine amidotransferase [Deferribacteraceae bacterium]
MKRLIIQTGAPVGLTSYNTFWEMFFDEGGCSDEDTVVVDVSKGERLLPPSAYSSAIITGSPAMITDKHEWSERSACWVVDAVKQRLPLFGVCYGHQLISYALGGSVIYLEGGVELGSLDIYLNGREHPFLEGLPAVFKANLVHSQSVSALPRGAISAAYSKRDPNQIIIYNDTTFSVQFHPEYSKAVMQDYIELYKRQEPRNADVYSKLAADDTPISLTLLRKFILENSP